MIIFWYGITLLAMSLLILIAYFNNSKLKGSGMVTVTIPNYEKCIVTVSKVYKGRAFSISQYHMKDCIPDSSLCGLLRRTRDYDKAIRT